MRKLISGSSKYEGLVGYSRAVVVGPWAFLSGVTGGDPSSGEMPADVIGQARNAFAKIETVLAQAGFGFADVVRATYYITQASYHDDLMPTFRGVFGEIRPAVTCVVVAGLIEPDMKVEIEVTALKDA